MVALTFVTAFAAVLVASQQVLATPDEFSNLLARQASPIDTSKIPSQCKSSCEGLTTSLTSCTTIDCFCTDSIMSGLTKCFSCAVNLKGSGLDAQSGQAVLDQFADGCKTAGSPVKATTISKDSGVSPLGVEGSTMFVIAAVGATLLLA